MPSDPSSAHRSPSAGLLGAAAGAAWAALMGAWLYHGSRPPPPPARLPRAPPGSAAPEPASAAPRQELFTPAWSAAVAGELEALAEGPASDRDPLVWGERVGGAPALRAYHAWVATAGDLSARTTATRDTLAHLDQAAREAGLSAPFRAWLDLAPDPRPRRLPRALDDRLPPGVPTEFTGWFSAALAHAAAYDAGVRALDAQLKAAPQGPYPGGIRDSKFATYFSLGEIDFLRFINGAALVPEYRLRLGPATEDLAFHAHRVLLCAARSVRHEPRYRLAVCTALASMVQRLRPVTWAGWAQLPPGALLGTEPDRPELRLLVGMLQLARGEMYQSMGRELTAAYAPAIATFRRAQVAEAPDEAARAARDLAATGLFRATFNQGDFPRVARDLAYQLDRFDDVTPFVRPSLVWGPAKRAARREDAMGLPPELMGRLAEKLLELQDELDPLGTGEVMEVWEKLLAKAG